MAKSATKSTAPAVSSAFAPVIRFSEAPAPIERKVGGDKSPYASVMESLPAPDGNKYANFFVPAEPVDAAITDAGERAKQSKENARKLSNSLSGLSRRITKKNASFAFVMRTREEDGVLGVAVYRVNPTPKATPAPAAT